MNANEEERLLQRVAERCEGIDDWRLLERQARRDGALWERLAATLRDAAALRVAGELVAADVDSVALPPPSAVRGRGHSRRSGGSMRAMRATGATRALAGAAAAGVLLLAAWFAWRPAARPTGDETSAGLVASESENAQPIGELVPLIVQTRPVEGGYEVIYVRQIVEREVVPEVYEMGLDEHSLPALQPARIDVRELSRL